MTPTLARRERHDLCDLALALGPAAPTLCAGWDAADLLAHLLVREQRPLGAVGIFVPRLAGLADRAMAHARNDGFDRLVARVRSPRITPFVGPLDGLVNTLEHLVHHEDLRRAQPAWDPRTLDAADLDAVWAALGRTGRMLVAAAGVPVEVERTDTGAVRSLRGGAGPVRVSGPVVEVALRLFGRQQVRDVGFDGPEARVRRLQQAGLGI